MASSARRLPIGTGLAFANRYRDNGNVCVTYFGDGAANQGQVYESFNMAKLWELPVVYVIENNQYGMGTSVKRASATTDLSQRGLSFDIPGEQVDGMDVRAVKAAADKALQHARSRQGPDDPGNADLPLSRPLHVRPGQIPRPGGSAEDARRARPDRAGRPSGCRTRAGRARTTLKGIDKDIRRIVNEAAEFAQQDAEPDASELWTDVYA